MRILGSKQYELSDHLGNVLATVLDKKTGFGNTNGLYNGFYANLSSVTDYYPGGMEMPGRIKTFSPYRFGNQKQEEDNEIYGDGNVSNFKYRFEDTRLNRFFSVDPLSKKYPWNSSYAFSENRLIDGVELEGLEFSKHWSQTDVAKRTNELISNPLLINQGGGGTCTIAAITYLFIKQYPEIFKADMMGLYYNGSARISLDYKISPDDHLFDVDPATTPNLTHDPKKYSADWIFLSSVQDSQNGFYDYDGVKGDVDGEGNYPSDVKDLMRGLLRYNSIKQFSMEGKPSLLNKVVENINKNAKEGYSTILAIDAKLIPSYNGTLNTREGHNVTLLTPIKVITQNGVNTYQFEIQTWGRATGTQINASQAEMEKYFYDYTSGKVED